MMKNTENQYDGMVILDIPIKIKDDEGKALPIYGLLYNKEYRHNDDLWQWQLNRYLCYLLGCTRIQKNKGTLVPDLFITSEGNSICMNDSVKNLLYRLLKKDMPTFRVMESDKPFEIEKNEIDCNFIISKKLIDRYTVSDTNKAKR